MSMAGFLVHCSFAAVQLQQKQSQSLRVDPYVSHRGGSIVVLPAANVRGPPDKYGLLTLGRPSVLLLLYASGLVSCVRQHASCQPSSKAMMAARGGRANFFDFFRMLWYEQFFFGDAELFSPSMIGCFSKYFFS